MEGGWCSLSNDLVSLYMALQETALLGYWFYGCTEVPSDVSKLLMHLKMEGKLVLVN